jgi:arylsulfatase A
MTRHCLTAILMGLSFFGTVLPAEERPNILFILIDDLGWMDLHCQGNSAVHTPNIDRFAEEGMRFTDAYAAAPVCSPTRAAIITGQSPARLQITNHIPDRKSFIPENAKLLPADMLDRLPLEADTLAERLQGAGYATAFLGKWHLSGPEKPPTGFEPDHQGFDLNLGGCGLGGPPTFFDPYRIFSLPSRKPGEYLPDRLADETIAFMTENRSRPFFIALWNYTVHWPMEAPAQLLEKYAGHKGPGLNDSRYGAMIEAMDLAIGRILAALEQLELESNTLVVFTSDNGGFSGVADNRPLRNGKGDLYEGGIRVPLIVRWPGKVKAWSLCRTPVISMDFFPTLLEAAGLTERTDLPLDGESLMPLLRQSGGLDRGSLYFHYPNYAWHRSNRLGGAIRKGPYKLIERFDDGSLELFDLENDLSEKRNLAAEKPELAAELVGELQDWREEVGAAMPTRSSGE